MIRYLTVYGVLFGLLSCSNIEENPFWGDGREKIERQELFDTERFPNVVVATDGTVVAAWGGIATGNSGKYRVKLSRDGGITWDDEIIVSDPGFHGGGVTVDANTGTIFAFIEDGHPPSPLTVYKSTDHGKSWTRHDVVVHTDLHGNMPSMHMNETGITLAYGPHSGRLIRPSRFYRDYTDRSKWGEDYSNAVYSDDSGMTWYVSEPFPATGTGEAAIVELSDGTIYFNSRRHVSTDGLDPRMRYSARSYDGGQTWQDLSVSNVLPDGPQDTDYGLMAGLVRLPLEKYDILLFSNVESEEGRERGTIWASFDGGRTWPVKRLVEEGGFAYSSLAAGRAGTPSEGWIYLLYEGGGHPNSKGYIARFNLAWVTGGKDWREFLPD